jgi:hypothetical protein
MTRIDCRDFEERLDEFEAGTLAAEEQQSAISHLEICVRCRALLGIVRGETDLLALEEREKLAQSILRRTSGPACRNAEDSLCQWIDGALSQADQQLISLHLAHCHNCAELAATLSELYDVLPDMATIEPDRQFTADVLQATLGMQFLPRRQGREFDWRKLWNCTMRRPRFAWEAAYVGTLLVLMMLGSPGIFPIASTVPQLLVSRSDQLLQQTGMIFADRQEAAMQSFGALEQKGKDLMNKAAALRSRTSAFLREEVKTILEGLETSLPDADLGPKQERDLP